ncbi:MAG: hypothetical protein K9L28_08260 [Synergistales bacterium]|nr:hypothetical protein [Synergistales bacterium]
MRSSRQAEYALSTAEPHIPRDVPPELDLYQCAPPQALSSFSQIGPSPLFGAYRFIKERSGKGQSHREITEALPERFGDRNADVGVAALQNL